MSKRCPKIRERKDSGFSPGFGLFLIPVVFVLAQISRSSSRTEWFARQVGLDGLHPTIVFLILLASTLLVAGVALWLIKRYRRNLQGLRNAEIQLPGPKALFLRPYFSDTKITLPNPYYSFWATGFSGLSIDGGFLLPEQFVGRVLEPFINVVQVGRSPTSISNGTWTVPDDEWKPAVAEAVDAASVIIILPVLREEKKTGRTMGVSTMLELHYLVESAQITRTIVIMPAAIWYSRRRIARGWEQARQKAARFGLFLPPYHSKGAVMTFEKIDGSWQVSQIFDQGICTRRKIAFGLVEAVKSLSQRNSFALLDR